MDGNKAPGSGVVEEWLESGYYGGSWMFALETTGGIPACHGQPSGMPCSTQKIFAGSQPCLDASSPHLLPGWDWACYILQDQFLYLQSRMLTTGNLTYYDSPMREKQVRPLSVIPDTAYEFGSSYFIPFSPTSLPTYLSLSSFGPAFLSCIRNLVLQLGII